jgi:NAD(P)H-quinone oxidoreductase subunit K
MDAIVKLRKKISNESFQERHVTEPTHRYYSHSHQMRVVAPIHDGRYLDTSERQAPSKEMAQAAGLPLPQLQTKAGELTES